MSHGKRHTLDYIVDELRATLSCSGWTEEALQAEIQEGIDDLAQGQYTDYDDTSLLQLFKTVKKRGRKRLKALKNCEH